MFPLSLASTSIYSSTSNCGIATHNHFNAAGMAGFEIAGVILGAYPLIETALTIYMATKTTGNTAISLTRRLKVETEIYRQFVLKLLASDVPEEEIRRLLSIESNDRQRWNDSTLHEKLFRRLGTETAVLILDILKELNKILSDLSEEFMHLNRGVASERRINNSDDC